MQLLNETVASNLGNLERALGSFRDDRQIQGKGALSLALVLTRKASVSAMPLNPQDFLTRQGGQVSGMGKSAVQSILRDHGIDRVLAEEAGRTSRGSIARMHAYIEFMNRLHAEGLLDFRAIERWWVERVKEYFASKPFRLRLDPSRSLRHAMRELLESAFDRQREMPGMMFAGAMMQHLVGARLELMSLGVPIEHWGFSVADSPGGRKGDFLVHDVSIHVTTAPTEALLRKCRENLDQGLRPLIITTGSGMGGAHALARNAGLADRIDILEIEQFMATGVYERSGFRQVDRSAAVTALIERYNRIVEASESDPSLKIAVGV